MTADMYRDFTPVDIPPEPEPNGQKAPSKPALSRRWFRLPGNFPEAVPPRLLKGLIAHGNEVLIWGPPEAGKTFFTVDLACRLATGEPWRGRPVDRGTVVYLAGERRLSLQARIEAWALRNGNLNMNPARLPILVLDRPLNLMKPGDDLAEAAAAVQQTVAEHALPSVVAIVADTLHSLSPGSREDSESFGTVMANARELRDLLQTPGGPLPALVYVHHCGKNEDLGPRGSNSMPAGVDVSIGISVRLEKWRLVEVDKGSDLADHPELEPFVIENVTLRHEPEPVSFGVHVAVDPGTIPHMSDDEAKTKALQLHKQGKSVRSIAAAVGKGKTTVHRWIDG